MKTIKLPRGTWRYDPDRQLGEEGGFGAVFAGLDQDGNDVAVKRLHIFAAQDAHRELRLAEELSGREFSHIIPILDAGHDAGSDAYYVVMARAERNLQDVIYGGEIKDEVEAVVIMSDIARGLREVSDIVHRDLKPANILRHDGRWKIADFGIARFVGAATSARTLKKSLTPEYAAPEQWRGERATPATDVYALGCIGYALLTGSPPFVGGTEEELGDQHLLQPPSPLKDASPHLRSLVSMMLHKEPQSRPSIDRVLRMLARLDRHESMLEGAKRLGQVGADLAQERLQADAADEVERVKREKRQRAAITALNILAGMSDELFQRIVDTTSEAYRKDRPEGVLLGGAELTLKISRSEIPENLFSHSGWDVLVGGWIEVKPPSGDYKRSASLWYTDLGQEGDYRWYEVCYMTSPLIARSRYDQPFALEPGEEADYAASNVMHTHQFAAKPKPIDDEDFDDFCDRWMGLLAQAAEGKLEHPRNLPLD